MSSSLKHQITVLDTSMLVVHLRVPEYKACGPTSDRWDFQRIEKYLQAWELKGARFVIPFAALIETASHIAKSNGDRFALSTELRKRAVEAIDGTSPWIAFCDQNTLWESEPLKVLLHAWPPRASEKVSLADTTIVEVANFYRKLGHPVEILTGDNGLKACEPAPIRTRRRRL